MNMRRILRTTRITNELGFSDTLDALEAAQRYQSALKVIQAWAKVPGALEPNPVQDLCTKALSTKEPHP